jgi:hypothetical protein
MGLGKITEMFMADGVLTAFTHSLDELLASLEREI